MTLGLPIVRTSPDHGTAFGIAGKDEADPGAMIAAIRLAASAAERRAAAHDALTARACRRCATSSRGMASARARRWARISCSTSNCSPGSRAIPGDLTDAEVLEVGPGPGGLTRALLAAGARVTAIERDRRCIPGAGRAGGGLSGPAARDRGRRAGRSTQRRCSRGGRISSSNLPYNVGTALLVRWLSATWPPWWRSLTLMFQKEVAERIVARPDDDAYGRLAVLAQWRSEREARDEGPSLGLHAAAQGDVGGRPYRPGERAGRRRVRAARTSDRRRLRPAAQDAASEPEGGAGRAGGAGARRDRRDATRRDGERRGIRRAGARLER